jgi:hypothetical protein
MDGTGLGSVAALVLEVLNLGVVLPIKINGKLGRNN